MPMTGARRISPWACPTRADALALLLARQLGGGLPFFEELFTDALSKHRPRGDLDEIVFDAGAFYEELRGKSWREVLQPYFPVRAARGIARERPALPRPIPLRAPRFQDIVALKCSEQRALKELRAALDGGGRLDRKEALEEYRRASQALRDAVEDLRAVRKREKRRAS